MIYMIMKHVVNLNKPMFWGISDSNPQVEDWSLSNPRFLVEDWRLSNVQLEHSRLSNVQVEHSRL
mgnify:FL=1